MGIALLVDDKLIGMPESVEQAKKVAEPYIIEQRKISIKQGSTVAPMQIWIYDYKEQDWVEQK